ncbi:hypothetical protein ASF16_09695 [Acidovorax sp. Leaf78]|nr:hypothetical protein ASF16_09695 [Acidovorax sp. Leaf78]
MSTLASKWRLRALAHVMLSTREAASLTSASMVVQPHAGAEAYAGLQGVPDTTITRWLSRAGDAATS